MFLIFRTTYVWQIVSCFILSLIFWLILIYILRYTFKIMLMYKGNYFKSKFETHIYIYIYILIFYSHIYLFRLDV